MIRHTPLRSEHDSQLSRKHIDKALRLVKQAQEARQRGRRFYEYRWKEVAPTLKLGLVNSASPSERAAAMGILQLTFLMHAEWLAMKPYLSKLAEMARPFDGMFQFEEKLRPHYLGNKEDLHATLNASGYAEDAERLKRAGVDVNEMERVLRTND